MSADGIAGLTVASSAFEPSISKHLANSFAVENIGQTPRVSRVDEQNFCFLKSLPADSGTFFLRGDRSETRCDGHVTPLMTRQLLRVSQVRGIRHQHLHSTPGIFVDFIYLWETCLTHLFLRICCFARPATYVRTTEGRARLRAEPA